MTCLRGHGATRARFEGSRESIVVVVHILHDGFCCCFPGVDLTLDSAPAVLAASFFAACRRASASLTRTCLAVNPPLYSRFFFAVSALELRARCSWSSIVGCRRSCLQRPMMAARAREQCRATRARASVFACRAGIFPILSNSCHVAHFHPPWESVSYLRMRKQSAAKTRQPRQDIKNKIVVPLFELRSNAPASSSHFSLARELPFPADAPTTLCPLYRPAWRQLIPSLTPSRCPSTPT